MKTRSNAFRSCLWRTGLLCSTCWLYKLYLSPSQDSSQISPVWYKDCITYPCQQSTLFESTYVTERHWQAECTTRFG